MIEYFCNSIFLESMTWEDFLPLKKGLPKATIETSCEDNGYKEVKETIIEPAESGWYNVYIPEFTIDNVKNALAQLSKTTPDNISIDWRGTAQAC